MRQIVMTSPGQVEYRDVETPTAGAGEVLMRIRRIGICGSDVHVYHGTHPYTDYPIVQGHEFSATVEAVGDGVTGISVGAMVTAMPQVVCGRCPPCRRGDYHICDTLKVLGFQTHGVGQDLFAIPADKVFVLPESFTFEQGALVEPTAVAVHAVGRGGDVAGRNVVVLGGGPIGNLVGQVAGACGANVLICEISAHRLEVARQCGLTDVCDAGSEPLTDASRRVFGDEGYSLALECVGVEPTIAAAIDSIAKGGTIVVVGVFGEKPRLDLGIVQDRELNLVGTLMYKHEDYERAIELIAGGEVVTDPLMSRHFPFEQFLAAYECIEKQRDKVMKVFIDC